MEEKQYFSINLHGKRVLRLPTNQPASQPMHVVISDHLKIVNVVGVSDHALIN